jgi:CHAD domain-containing protein
MIPVGEAVRPNEEIPAPHGGEPSSAKPRRKKNTHPTPARLLRHKTRTFFHHLAFALTGDVESIHQLRVSGRRLRGALLLLAAKPEGRRARRVQKALRNLTRTAGKARDLDVLLETYSARLKALPSRTAEQRRLAHRLRDASRRGRMRMAEELLDTDLQGLRQDLTALTGRARTDLLTLGQRVRDIAAREGKALTEGLVKVGALLDANELHQLRRHGRRLRYAVEVYDESLDVASGGTKPWKALQESIGAIHDYHMLAAWFDRQATRYEARGNRAVAEVARAEAEWARATMAKLHDDFLAFGPSGLVRQGLAAIAPSMTKQSTE